MIGIEIDFIVKDCLAALSIYQQIFDLNVIEATSYVQGYNEVIFNLYGTRFHMLDENIAYGLFAPKVGEGTSIWFNVMVEDIKEVYAKAISIGCTQIQPITEVTAMGVMNGVFTDPYGYMWMLHQMMKEVSFEERCSIIESQTGLHQIE